MSNSEKLQAMRETRERAERLRALHEQWRLERLHDIANIFERVFNEKRNA